MCEVDIFESSTGFDPLPREQATLAGKSMNPKSSSLVVLAIALSTSVATAAEAVWPTNSASEIAVFVTVLRFRIYAEHCSAHVPELKPRFEGLMQGLDGRIQGLSQALVASDAFRDMKDAPVPVEIVEALEDSFHDGKHNLERQDASAVCPKKLQDFGDINDESLKEGLAANLKAVQNMMRNLGRKSAR